MTPTNQPPTISAIALLDSPALASEVVTTLLDVPLIVKPSSLMSMIVMA